MLSNIFLSTEIKDDLFEQKVVLCQPRLNVAGYKTGWGASGIDTGKAEVDNEEGSAITLDFMDSW